MLYVSLMLNLALAATVGYLWLKTRDVKNDSERTAREFELMLQAEQAEQRTELLQVHAMLMQAQQELLQRRSTGSAPSESPLELPSLAE